MLFESKDCYVELVEDSDVDRVMQVYNSNGDFLIKHMDWECVTTEWVAEEFKAMQRIGFCSCKILDKDSRNIIGTIDFKVDQETYLSLLIIHNDYKNQGLGKQILNAFEKYVQSLGSKCIRIDVVTDYDTTVLDFWANNGFVTIKDVQLNWVGKVLPAVMMKKNLFI